MSISVIAMGSPSRMLAKHSKIGRISFHNIFDMFYPERGRRHPFTLSPEEFLALPKIREMEPEDKKRWWILLSFMYYLSHIYGVNEIRWNRHHTLAVALNLGRSENQVRIDIGGGKMSDGVTEHAYDATVLLAALNTARDANEYESPDIAEAEAQAESEFAKINQICTDIAKGREWEGWCTGSVWEEIFTKHPKSMATFPLLKRCSPEQERSYEFGKAVVSFNTRWHEPIPAPIGVFTFGSSTGAIQIGDRKVNEINLGSKSKIFSEGFPTLAELNLLF